MYRIPKHYFLRSLLLTFSLFLSFPCFSDVSILQKTLDYQITVNRSGDIFYEELVSINGKQHSFINWERTKELQSSWQSSRTGVAGVQGQFGQKSTGTVVATVPATVSKKSVMQKVLSKARIGGRALGWVGAALLAKDAYDLVSETLRDSGWRYDKDVGDFITTYEYTGNVVGFADTSVVFASIPIRADELNNNLDSMYSKAVAACESIDDWFSREYKAKGYTKFIKQSTLNKGTLGTTIPCSAFKADGYVQDLGSIVIVESGKRAITQQEFDDIILPIADLNPNPFVNVTRENYDGPVPDIKIGKIKVADNSEAVSEPFTNPLTGKAEQTKWTFKPDGTVIVETTLRPDLQPNSDTAPVPKPIPEPKPELNPDSNTQPKPQETPDFCKTNPNILACQEIGDYDPEEIDIPRRTETASFSPDLFLPTSGSCPAPISFRALGRSYQIIYDPLCELCSRIRGVVLLCFMVAAAYIAMGAMKVS